MDENEYCILWNNYHEALINTLCGLQREGDMADVTMVCGDGSRVRAHQVILAACSSFFRDFLLENPSKHPIVLLPMEIRYPELKAMVEFMYTGQVCLSQDRLQSFMRGARYLRIRGVEETSAESFMEDFTTPASADMNNGKGEILVADTGTQEVYRDKTMAATAIPVVTTSTEVLPSKEERCTQWTECIHCHSRNILPHQESPSTNYICAACSAPGSSKSKVSDQGKKKKGKRKLHISNKTEQKDEGSLLGGGGEWIKKIKLEPQEKTIEVQAVQDKTEEEDTQQVIYCTAQDKVEPSVGKIEFQLKPPSSTVTTVNKLKKSHGSRAADQSRKFYGAIQVKKEQQQELQSSSAAAAAVFKVRGIFGVTGRKKRYPVTEAELLRRQGSPEHFSNNAMKTYLRFPRTQDALPLKFRTPSQRKTTISTFTNIIEGEAADLAQDFQRFLFSSNLMEYLCDGVEDMSSIGEVLDRMLDNLSQVDWTIKFNLLTHGAGLLFVRAVLLYVRSISQ